MTFKKWLKSKGPCLFAWTFAKRCNFNPELIWSDCNRGDWLMWLLGNGLGRHDFPTKQELVLTSCKIVRTVLHLVKEESLIPKKTIDTAEGWANGFLLKSPWAKTKATTAATAILNASKDSIPTSGYYAARAAAHTAAIMGTGQIAGYAASVAFNTATAILQAPLAANDTKSKREKPLLLIADIIRSETQWEYKDIMKKIYTWEIQNPEARMCGRWIAVTKFENGCMSNYSYGTNEHLAISHLLGRLKYGAFFAGFDTTVYNPKMAILMGIDSSIHKLIVTVSNGGPNSLSYHFTAKQSAIDVFDALMLKNEKVGILPVTKDKIPEYHEPAYADNLIKVAERIGGPLANSTMEKVLSNSDIVRDKILESLYSSVCLYIDLILDSETKQLQI